MENIGHVPMYIPYIYVYIYTYISQVGALTHLFSWHPRSWFASFSYFCPGWVSLRYSISLCHLSWWLLSWLLLHMYILIYVTELYIYIYVYIYIYNVLIKPLTNWDAPPIRRWVQPKRCQAWVSWRYKIGPKQRLEDSGCPNNINRQ